jgi:putative phage-type endonuclease
MNDRKQGIGGSEVAAILGISPWEGPLQVYARKVGLIEDVEPSLPMRVGKNLEALILEEYGRHTNQLVVRNLETFSHPKAPWRLATPDGFVLGNGRTVKWGVEAKAVGSPIGWGPGEEEIPSHYLVQVVWYSRIISDVYATDIPWWDVAVLIGNKEMRYYRIQRNYELEEELIEAVDKFWHDHVLKRMPPEPTNPKDREITQKIPQTTRQIRPATPDEEELVGRLKEVYLTKLAIEREYDTLVALLQSKIGGAGGLATSYGTITWLQTKPIKKVDWKAVAMEYNPPEELIQKFTEEKPGPRRFLVPSAWGKEEEL